MKGKIRILFAIPNFLTSGSGMEMFHIVEGLDKKLFEPVIAVQKAGGTLYDHILNKGYHIIIAPFIASSHAGKIEQLKLIQAYATVYKPYRFHIWQSFNWSSDYTEALVAKASGARYVYVKKNMNWSRLAWKVKSILSSAIVARNKDLVSGSLSAWYLKGKVSFIPGGVDVSKFKPGGDKSFRQRLNISYDARVVLCVAQLVRIKGQDTLIKAMSQLDDNVVLVLAGRETDTVYTEELKALVSMLGLHERVVFAGTINDVSRLLNAGDVFVLPTSRLHGHEEGCPVALLEAMAAGIPCIASNVAGSRDVITQGVTGLLFEPGDISGLIACITKLREDILYAEQISRAARQSIEERYTVAIEADAFSKLYQKIVGRY